MQILPSRYLVLKYILDAYNILNINVPLICYDGKDLIPFTGTRTSWLGSFDDIGIFVLIPKIIKFFNISVDAGITIFFNGLFYGSCALGLIGLLLAYRTLLQRCVVLFALLLFLKVCIYANDVYIAYTAAIMGVVPLFLYLCEKKNNSALLGGFLFVGGLFLGILHYVRSFSSLPVIGFICMYLLMQGNVAYKKKLYLGILFFCGLTSTKLYFDAIVKEYKSYAAIHCDASSDLPTQHPIWHTIYAGFGFLKWLNVDHIEYDDGCVEKAVIKESPTASLFQMNDYEAIVKNKVLDLLKHQKTFVLMTIFAKLGVLFLYLLISANFGLLAMLSYPKPWYLELAFFIGFSLSLLFPLIALPITMFSLSFLTFGVLYCIVSINYFLRHKEEIIISMLKSKVNKIIMFVLPSASKVK